MDRDEAQPLYDEAIEKVGVEDWKRRYKAAAFDCHREEFVRGSRFLRVWIQWHRAGEEPVLIEEVYSVPVHRLSPTRDHDYLRIAEDQMRLRCGRAYALLDLGVVSPQERM